MNQSHSEHLCGLNGGVKKWLEKEKTEETNEIEKKKEAQKELERKLVEQQKQTKQSKALPN